MASLKKRVALILFRLAKRIDNTVLRETYLLGYNDATEVLQHRADKRRDEALIHAKRGKIKQRKRLFKRKYEHLRPFEKRTILANASWKCHFCGKTATTIDHLTPRSRGGSNRLTNLVAACEKCNRQKADMLESEYIEFRIRRNKL